MRIVNKSQPVNVQNVGKCLTQWQTTLTFDSPVNDVPYTELTEHVRAYLPNYPSISTLAINQVDPSLVSVVYVVDSSD